MVYIGYRYISCFVHVISVLVDCRRHRSCFFPWYQRINRLSSFMVQIRINCRYVSCIAHGY